MRARRAARLLRMFGTGDPRPHGPGDPVAGGRSRSGASDEAPGHGTSGGGGPRQEASQASPGPEGSRSRRARLAAVLGTLAVLAYAVVGVLLLAGGRSAPPVAALAWAAVGVVIAGVLLATAWRTPSLRLPEVVVEYALVLGGGALAFVVATSASGGAPVGRMSGVGLVAGVVALGTGVGARAARRRAGRRP